MKSRWPYSFFGGMICAVSGGFVTFFIATACGADETMLRAFIYAGGFIACGIYLFLFAR